MTVKFNNITVQMVGDDQSPISGDLLEKSSHLHYAFSYNLARVIVPAADHLDTSRLGTLWPEILPADDGFTVEIATVLPFYLPDLGNSPECSLTTSTRELFISSRMVRCFYSDPEGEKGPLQYYLVHRTGLESLIARKGLIHFHPIPMRTFVSTKIKATALTAETLIRESFPDWMSDFVADISRLIDAVRVASPPTVKHLLPQAATPFLPVFWVTISGAGDKIGSAQFAGDMPSVAFKSLTKLEEAAVDRVRSFLSAGATASIHEAALSLARTYRHYGYYGLSLVQVCIACENSISLHYKTFLTNRGVSTRKYAESQKDITYSQLLNLHLAAMRDISNLPNREEILGRLNFARRCRNGTVHGSDSPTSISPKEVDQAIEAAEQLIRFLEDGQHAM